MRKKLILLSIASILQPAAIAGNSGVLSPDSARNSKELHEIVVTALGIGRERRSLGYSVASLDAGQLNTSGTTTLSAALQGKVSGLDIRPSSGAPGASDQMWIRGARSFSGNNTPLWVIDGMPVESCPDFSTGYSTKGADHADRSIDINPDEIENVTVLKGQAAAALYGIRASNGVIVITTRRGSARSGRPSVTLSTDIAAETASRRFHRQEVYAQGNSINAFDPNSANTWGPRISSLPDDPTYGGNLNGHPGQYRNPKLELAGLDPWTTPTIHDNIGAFLRTGITENTRLTISQRTGRSSYSVGVGNTYQKGIVPNTGMTRWNVRGNFSLDLSPEWKTGMSANYSSSVIKSAPGANNAIMNSVNTAPAEYDLKGTPFHKPNDPTAQVSYRPNVYDNPYWWAANNEYRQHTNRGFGNVWLDYAPGLLNRGIFSFRVHEQAGIDFYTADNTDLLRIGSAAARSGSIENYGISRNVFNNLLTVDFAVRPGDFDIELLLGNEINQDNARIWDYVGKGFNFYGFPVMSNATVFNSDEYTQRERTVGFFGSLSAGWRGMLYLGATLRNDHVSMMPRGHRSLVYPSYSLSWLFSEMPGLRENATWLSLGKLRVSYAQVGQAAHYLSDYYSIPTYGGGMYTSRPLAYPIGGISSYVPYAQIYDPDLHPQNTRNLETGIDLAFLDNRIRASYTLSLQDVRDQIFSVPQAGSTGYIYMLTNAGQMRTWSNEIDLEFRILEQRDYALGLGVNLTTVRNRVVSLAPGVESIMIGGFTSPQIRAEEGKTYPIVYGTSFKRDAEGRMLLRDGLPQSSGESVDLGECSPDLLAGLTLTGRWKGLRLSATLSWQQGGKMYHGSNMVLNASGVTKASLPYHEGTMVAEGIDESTGLPNLVEVDRQKYYQTYYSITESAVYDMSFVKLRDLTLSYQLPKAGPFTFTVSAFVRNLLLWTRLPDFDPESSQGNGNMGGYFERFSLPATTAYGGGLKIEF